MKNKCKEIKIRSFFSETSGVAAVEFGLIAPVLIFVLLGVLDLCMYANTALRLENTARSSVEYVLQGGDPDNIQDEVIGNSALAADDVAAVSITNSDYVCTCVDGLVVNCDGGSCSSEGDYMRRYYQVTLDMDYSLLFPYPGLPENMSMRGHAIMRVN